MDETSKLDDTGEPEERRDQASAEPAVLEEDAGLTEEDAADDAAEGEPAVEDGLSEASAEASIAALVEAEREAQAEEAAVEEAEAALEREEPDEDEPAKPAAKASKPTGKPAAKAADRAPAKAASKTRTPKAPTRRLAVLGSPIDHSRSPQLHRAAYDALGLDWAYDAVEATEQSLPEFLAGLGPEWRGLSLTMPLKRTVLPLLTETDRIAEQTGGANTVLLDGEDVRGFNTDVAGIVRAVQAAGVAEARFVHILGGGATSASALVAAAELGAERVDVHVRDLARSSWIEPLANELGLRVRIRPFAQADRSLDVPDLVISTLPGGTDTEAVYTDSTRRRALLLDVAYEPWPTPIARQWQAVGGHVVSGLAMLVHQALLQVRIFVAGDPLEPLPDEAAVLAAMLDAAGIDGTGAPLDD